MFLQEPYLSYGKPFGLRRQHFHHVHDGRTAIYTPKLVSSSFLKIPSLVSNDLVAGVLEWDNKKVVVASLYLDGTHKNPIKPDLEKLINHCKRYNLGLICGADVNAWSDLWFSERLKQRNAKKQWKRGNLLEEYFLENDIKVINSHPKPTYVTPGRDGTTIKSTIDVTFTFNFPDPIMDWGVSSHVLVSDHKPITYHINCSKGPKTKSRNFYKADWTKFANIIESEMPPIQGGRWSQKRIEEELEVLYKYINHALDITCPARPRKAKLEAKWWNEECEKAKNAFKTLQRSIYRKHRNNDTHPSKEEWLEIKKARKNWTRTLKKARRDAWRDFTAEVDSVSEAAKLYKVITTDRTQEVGLLRKQDGSMCTDSGETVNVLLEEHFPRCEIGTELQYAPGTNTVKVKHLNWCTSNIVKKAIQEFGPHKGAGPDGLKPIVLQHLPQRGLDRLSEIYKACIALSYSPHKWRLSKVSFMPKQNKPDKENARSYRPLSLTSYLLKGLERVIKYHLEDEAFVKYPRHKKQFAFQKNKGTDDALSHTVNSIEKGLLRHQYVIAVFMDIQGAFDNIHPDAINKAMKDSGIPPYIRKWYSNLLTNRECECTIGNTTVKAKLNSGIPQGAVLSPPVGWNPSMDKLLILIDTVDVEQSCFADDAAFIAANDDPKTAQERAQESINKAVIWANEHGLRFSAAKTQVLFMTKNKKYTMPPKLKLYGEEIDYVDSAKYLGVTIDKDLSWKKHIYSKIQSSKWMLMKAKAALDHAWGPRPKYMAWFWTSVMRPKITYGAFVWAKVAQEKKVQDKLRSIQRFAMMMIAPVRHSSPTRAMEIIYNITPLHLHIKYLAISTLVRIDAGVTWLSPLQTKGHIEYASKHLPAELKHGITDKAPFRRDWNINYTITIGDGVLKDWHPAQAEWSCFTDGSLLDGESGAGAVIYDNSGNTTELCEKPEGGTVFQCEVWALHMAATWLLERETRSCHIGFYVDSQAALRSVAAIHSDKITVNRTREALKQLSILNTVTLTWVKAHRKGADKASEANEKADAAARQATLIGPEDAIMAPMALAGAKNLIKTKIRDEWRKEWVAYPEGRQSHYFLDGPSTKFNKVFKHGRGEIARLVQYLTGHAFLRRHDKIVEHGTKDHGDNDECRLCCEYDEETPHHIITECPSQGYRRFGSFGSHKLDPFFTNWKVPQMMGYLDSSEFRELEATYD